MKTKDIKTRRDIIKLVDAFYDQVKVDPVIGYLFNDVARVNWEVHLPRMYDFWETIAFYTGSFDGNPMARHRELHQKSPLTQEHFEHWLALFTAVVDKLFQGPKADEIKIRARNIAAAMMYKTLQ